MNEGSVTLTGNVVTDVRHHSTAQGHKMARFRMVVQPRRFDKTLERWVDTEASFYSVVAWRTMAENVADSVRKGDPIIVSGRIRVREWERDGRNGTTVEVDAQAIGHDLSRGRTQFRRPARGIEGSLEPVEFGQTREPSKSPAASAA